PSALPHPVHRLSSEVVWGGSLFPRHWTLFTRASLHRMVQSVGFEVVEQASLVSPSFWTWSIHHWLMVHGWPRRIVDFSRPPTTLLLVLTAPLEVMQSVHSEPRDVESAAGGAPACAQGGFGPRAAMTLARATADVAHRPRVRACVKRRRSVPMIGGSQLGSAPTVYSKVT